MKPRKDSADRGAGSGCMARLVRLSSSPCDDKKDDLSEKSKVNNLLRDAADDLGFIGIVLCFGIVFVTGCIICLLWGKAKEIVSPPEPVKHQYYQKDLDDREKAGKVNNPRVIRRANNGGNSYHDTSKDADHRVGCKEGIEESIPVNLVLLFKVHSLNSLPNVKVHTPLPAGASDETGVKP